ncbi:penicillin acylase family protein, partial [bacterium]|nr:penicillin acylase family protein [bacterium]
MKWLRVVLSLILLTGIFWGLQFRHGFVPPLGKFLNPFSGFWQNSTRTDYIREKMTLPGLKDSVTVLWDERHVPHVFASNTHDLYQTQGYITARDRLWQMEFQTHYAAGRLSEIMGKETLDRDRYLRRIGMVYAAEKALQAVESSPQLQEIIKAYTQGVNQYIHTLNRKTLPVEYKILDYHPEPWTPLKCMLLLKYMALDLTSASSDAALTRSRKVFPESVIKKIYPLFGPFVDPVIPAGTSWDFEPSLPEKPEETSEEKPLLPFQEGSQRKLSYGETFPKGSNNWAVSGKKTDSGFPIL